jgi:hypothetical protein
MGGLCDEHTHSPWHGRRCVVSTRHLAGGWDNAPEPERRPGHTNSGIQSIDNGK